MSQSVARTALITGGMSGLGAAAATRLRADGVKVFTVDIAAGADFQIDVTDHEAVAKLPTQLPHIDILITSAGIVGPNIPLLQTTEEQWKSVFEINVLGTALFIKAFAPSMVENGWGRMDGSTNRVFGANGMVCPVTVGCFACWRFRLYCLENDGYVGSRCLHRDGSSPISPLACATARGAELFESRLAYYLGLRAGALGGL